MAHAIILSKDRPAQLHLCLEALDSNAGHIFTNVTVLYDYSSSGFALGYEKTKSSFAKISWILQDHYYDNVMELVDESFALTSFFTDDDITYRVLPCNLQQIACNFEEMDELGTFSLRLGLNTYIQDPYIASRAVAPTSGFKNINDRMLIWKWADCPPYGNFGYPLSVDGHIFRTTELKRILSACRFNNPNQQECAMQGQLSLLPPMMASFTDSVVVNTPLNRVQETCLNRSGESFGQDAESMNQRYLNGESLDLDSINFTEIVGCHQELKINWITK